jgi:hypothetical protein
MIAYEAILGSVLGKVNTTLALEVQRLQYLPTAVTRRLDAPNSTKPAVTLHPHLLFP